MTGCYSLQSSMAKTICEPMSRAGPRVHTIKFYQNCLKFVEMTQYDWQLLYAEQYG